MTGQGSVFRRPCGAVVKIDDVALSRMLEFRQWAVHHEEGGGVLLGRHLLGGLDVVIDEVSSPMPGDTRTRLAFHRSAAPHQQLIDARWRASEGTCLYLGEWHTHPESHPAPSLVDLGDWVRRLDTDRFEGPSLFFVIVGIQALCLWEGNRQQRSLVRLPPVHRP